MPEVTVKYDTKAPTLRRFMRSTTDFQFVMGPVGSGKTASFICKVLRLICEQRAQRDGVRRGRVCITRNTYPDLLTTTIRDWREIVTDEMGRFTSGHPPEHKLRFTLEDSTRVECDVIFIALDRIDHVKKLRGLQLSFAWMNECKEQAKAIFDMLTARVGRYPKEADGGSTFDGILGDYNAPDEDDWMYDLEQQKRLGLLPDYEFFIQPGGVIEVDGVFVVNPEAENLTNLRPGYYERLMQGKTKDFIRINIGNQYGSVFDGKPVHAEYNDDVHCWKELLEPIPGIEIAVGMDYGLTPAAVFLQKTPSGRWHAIDELVCEDMGAERFAIELQAKVAEYPGYTFKFWGDPSGDSRAQTDEDTVQQVLVANKIPARACTTNDVVLRRAALDRPLSRMIGGRPGIIISPKCKRLRKALRGGWCYKRVLIDGSGDRFHTEPEKNKYSHVGEACEYALLESGEKATISSTTKKRRRPDGRGSWVSL
jgi:hypothetical protein